MTRTFGGTFFLPVYSNTNKYEMMHMGELALSTLSSDEIFWMTHPYVRKREPMATSEETINNSQQKYVHECHVKTDKNNLFVRIKTY